MITHFSSTFVDKSKKSFIFSPLKKGRENKTFFPRGGGGGEEIMENLIVVIWFFTLIE